jgi:hypothetical protein
MLPPSHAMKKLILISALMGAMSLVLSGAECAGDGNETFTASLAPGNEVPPLPNAGQSGTAVVVINEDDRTLRATVTTNLDPSKVTSAHLHLGAAGSNGGVLFNLGSPIGSGFERSATDADLTAVGTVDTWAEFIAEVKAGNVYVNVHTTDNPAGEVRGQL